MKKRVRVSGSAIGTVLAGANVLLRECLARILSSADFRIIASTFYAGDQVLSSLAPKQPSLLVIDLSDDFEAALRQIESFKRLYPDGRIVVLADEYELTEIVSAFRVGANAYLAKGATCETLIKSIELVMLGVTLLPSDVLTLISDRQACRRSGDGADGGQVDRGEDVEPVGADVRVNRWVTPPEGTHPSRLSACQQSILRCLIQGDSNKTIARKMALAEATVKVHVKAILRKVRVHNRTQAAIWAMSNGSSMPTKGDASSALDKPPASPSTDLATTHASTAGRTNGAASLPSLDLNGADHVAMPCNMRLVRKSS
ncbi:LuxR C-terminal-related transcriptional regulator [Bradyrhizobium sp. STM 3557]|uniref:LuxR C-terminal-related transcriptional regulator n=1 Tax=Bradyrhizobium sp. STM 3557 TaxID=578920 RepID=UPI00388E36E6